MPIIIILLIILLITIIIIIKIENVHNVTLIIDVQTLTGKTRYYLKQQF